MYCRLVQWLERLDIGDRIVQREPVVRGADAVDRDEPRVLMVTVRRHHEMRHTTRDRIHDHVGDLSEGRVRALHAAAEIEPHTRRRSPRVTGVVIRNG